MYLFFLFFLSLIFSFSIFPFLFFFFLFSLLCSYSSLDFSLLPIHFLFSKSLSPPLTLDIETFTWGSERWVRTRCSARWDRRWSAVRWDWDHGSAFQISIMVSGSSSVTRCKGGGAYGPCGWARWWSWRWVGNKWDRLSRWVEAGFWRLGRVLAPPCKDWGSLFLV